MKTTINISAKGKCHLSTTRNNTINNMRAPSSNYFHFHCVDKNAPFVFLTTLY